MSWKHNKKISHGRDHAKTICGLTERFHFVCYSLSIIHPLKAAHSVVRRYERTVRSHSDCARCLGFQETTDDHPVCAVWKMSYSAWNYVRKSNIYTILILPSKRRKKGQSDWKFWIFPLSASDRRRLLVLIFNFHPDIPPLPSVNTLSNLRNE